MATGCETLNKENMPILYSPANNPVANVVDGCDAGVRKITQQRDALVNTYVCRSRWATHRVRNERHSADIPWRSRILPGRSE